MNHQSVNPLPIQESDPNPEQICKSITNLPIPSQSANPMPICQSNTNPGLICQSIANPPIQRHTDHVSRSPVAHTYQQDRHPLAAHWHALTQVAPIKGQSEDNCPTNLGTSLIYGPDEVSRRRTISMPIQSWVTANPRRSVTNLMSIHRQSGANSVPIRCQSVANPVSIHRQFSANLMPIWCQSDVHPVPIHCQSGANPSPILDQSAKIHQYGNPMSIHQQSPNSSAIPWKFANPMPMCQSNANLPIQCQHVNPTPTYQSLTNLPIRQSNANSVSICQSITNPKI